jgi:hypothetical protein
VWEVEAPLFKAERELKWATGAPREAGWQGQAENNAIGIKQAQYGVVE